MTFGYFSCCETVFPDFLLHTDVTAGYDAERQYVCKLFLIRRCLKLDLNLFNLLSNIMLLEHGTNTPLLFPITLLLQFFMFEIFIGCSR